MKALKLKIKKLKLKRAFEVLRQYVQVSDNVEVRTGLAGFDVHSCCKVCVCCALCCVREKYFGMLLTDLGRNYSQTSTHIQLVDQKTKAQ